MMIHGMVERQVKEGKASRRGRQVEGGWTVNVWPSVVSVLSRMTLANKTLSWDYLQRLHDKPAWKDPVLPTELHTNYISGWCKIKPNEPKLQNIQLQSTEYLSKDSWKLRFLLIALRSPCHGALSVYNLWAHQNFPFSLSSSFNPVPTCFQQWTRLYRSGLWKECYHDY